MRALSSQFAAALQSGATTLCHCWRVTRHDGAVFGFTDHDRDLTFGGTTYAAGTGLDASQMQASVGLGVGGGDVQGAFDAQGLTEADLSAGLWDDASVEFWLIDWSDTTNALLLDIATIGEVSRSEFSFVAELRSLAHRLDQQQGRYFQRACSADLGDARCSVDLASSAFTVAATVAAITGSMLQLGLDTPFASGFFTSGHLSVTGGAATGAHDSIRSHESTGQGDLVGLWSGVIAGLAIGDRVLLTAGCDKSPTTCVSKFANLANFRGFPQMPGNDVLLAYPNSHSPVMDGGSLFR